jgi:hypothetical protein
MVTADEVSLYLMRDAVPWPPSVWGPPRPQPRLAGGDPASALHFADAAHSRGFQLDLFGGIDQGRGDPVDVEAHVSRGGPQHPRVALSR